MPSKLEPRPFCEEAKFITVISKRVFNMDFHYVFCQICGSRGPMNLDKQAAIEAWNHRAEDKNGNERRTLK